VYHVGLDLTPAQVSQLKHKAVDEGTSVKDLVGRVVTEYLDEGSVKPVADSERRESKSAAKKK